MWLGLIESVGALNRTKRLIFPEWERILQQWPSDFICDTGSSWFYRQWTLHLNWAFLGTQSVHAHLQNFDLPASIITFLIIYIFYLTHTHSHTHTLMVLFLLHGHSIAIHSLNTRVSGERGCFPRHVLCSPDYWGSSSTLDVTCEYLHGNAYLHTPCPFCMISICTS